MQGAIGKVAIVGFAIAMLWCGRFCDAQTVGSTREENDRQYVLLANDRVLAGCVIRRGSAVIIRRGTESELTLRADQVRAVADDMSSLFEARSRLYSGSASPSLTDSLADARWCIDQGLPAQATQILMRVYAVAPEHPVALQLESRLRRLMAEPTPGNTDNTPNVIRPVNHSAATPVDEMPMTEATQSDASPSINALTAPSSLHAFTAKIQPILISRCAKCHHEQSAEPTSWNLVLPPSGSLRVNQRGSIANLEATLRLCNLSKPMASELLDRAIRDHQVPSMQNDSAASTPQPPIREHETALRRTLVDWIASIAKGPDPIAKRGIPVDMASPEILPEQPTEGFSEAFGQNDSESKSLNPIEPSDVAASLQRPPASVPASAPMASPPRSSGPVTRPTRLPAIENPNDPQHFNRETLLMRALGIAGEGG